MKNKIFFLIYFLSCFKMCYSYQNQEVHPFAITGRSLNLFTEGSNIKDEFKLHFYDSSLPAYYKSDDGRYLREILTSPQDGQVKRASRGRCAIVSIT